MNDRNSRLAPSSFEIQLSNVWQALFNSALANNGETTRQRVQYNLDQPIDEKATLSCLKSFKQQGLIECIKDGLIHDTKDDDYMISLTVKGKAMGPIYQYP